ncbi:DUF2972 domain-containing protein, partial [Campylobacter novaezeelandiae]|uniref:DUF2972 domain-containing protein n=1 Tax=Campylobacter novaezeelandiae TaxID=2267891 RepID=UPI0019066594
LLDPNKLKDINEELNYHSIDANLAWELNLPLPDNYEFVFWGGHGVGNFGFNSFMRNFGFDMIYYFDIFNSKNSYLHFYKRSLSLDCLFYIAIRDYSPSSLKCLYLINSKKSICLVRDPISSLKHHLNYKWPNKRCYLKFINLEYNLKEILRNRVAYITSAAGRLEENPSCNSATIIMDNHYSYFHDSALKKHLIGIRKTYFIDMQEIVGEKTIKTFKDLSKNFNLKKAIIEDKAFFNINFGAYVNMLPINIDLTKELNSNEKIIISLHNRGHALLKSKVDKSHMMINDIFSINDEDLSYVIETKYYDDLLKALENNHYLKNIEVYLNKLILAVKDQKQIEDKKRISEERLLEYFKKNKEMALKFKKILDEEHLPYIKEQRPDIVKSWKYYKEFERMCKELDGRD